MRWTKLGQIFDPTQHKLTDGCEQFAQSPQALVFEKFVRIYFSTRSVDASGKFLSRISFVDMSKDLRRVIRVSDKTVIELGELGCFDEHGIFPMNVLRYADAIWAYTCGWNRRVSVSVDTGIGVAVSHDDGITFQRLGPGPVLSASLHEPFLVGDGFVKVVGSTFHMWYIFGTGWRRLSSDTPPDRTYKIGHATSDDGINWTKEEARQIISDRLGDEESQALPTVIGIGERHHMFFCYRQTFDFRTNKDRGYHIGHAWSDDLTHWTRDDGALMLHAGAHGEWDSDMQCYPHVFECDGRVYLLYNGNEFGRCGFGAAVLEDTSATLVYVQNMATVEGVASHLRQCASSFVPPLDTRVDIDAYADKIVQRAVRFEAWSRGVLVGLVAAYLNDSGESVGFITSVSVLAAWQGQGVASTLLEQCLVRATESRFVRMELEVDRGNHRAVELYAKMGFVPEDKDDSSMVMHLDTSRAPSTKTSDRVGERT